MPDSYILVKSLERSTDLKRVQGATGNVEIVVNGGDVRLGVIAYYLGKAYMDHPDFYGTRIIEILGKSYQSALVEFGNPNPWGDYQLVWPTVEPPIVP